MVWQRATFLTANLFILIKTPLNEYIYGVEDGGPWRLFYWWAGTDCRYNHIYHKMLYDLDTKLYCILVTDIKRRAICDFKIRQ